jgi:hypothetical protein
MYPLGTGRPASGVRGGARRDGHLHLLIRTPRHDRAARGCGDGVARSCLAAALLWTGCALAERDPRADRNVSAQTAPVVPRVDSRATPEDELARLRHERAQLEILLRLASSNGFYLLLDVERRRLALMHGAALLREFPLTDLRVGWPRRFLREPDALAELLHRVWEGARLEPPRPVERIEIVPPETPVDSLVPYVPPPPEEAIPAPPRFRVRYEGGELEILAEGTTPEPLPVRWWRALRNALSDVQATLRGDRPRIRLRAVLPATEAGALYRSLPEGTPLYVLHPGPQAAAPAPDGPSGPAPPPYSSK